MSKRSDLVAGLQGAARALKVAANRKPSPYLAYYKAVKSELARFESALDALAEVIDADQDTEFSEFMGEIGSSVVQAQRTMDDQSRQYVSDARSDGVIPPSIFRIPKVTAEMRFELSHRGLLVKAFKGSKKSEETLEQSMKLEVQAVPAPPELLKAIQGVASPEIDFVLEPGVRQAVLTAVNRFAPSTANPTGVRGDSVVLRDANDPNRMLIWRGHGKRHFILLFAEQAAERRVGMWHVALSPPLMERFLLFTSTQAKNLGPLHDFVAHLADVQEAYLQILGGVPTDGERD